MDAQEKALLDFNLSLDKFMAAIPEFVIIVQKKLVFEVFSGVVKKTPVDTGRARSAWNIGIETPNLSVPPVRKRRRKKRDGSKVKVNTQDAGVAGAIAAARIKKPYIQVWITNNLGYIIYLEEGSSTQAPSGMVRVTILEVKTAFEGSV